MAQLKLTDMASGAAVLGLLGTIMSTSVSYGKLSARVDTLEAAPSSTVNVAVLQTKVEAISLDIAEIKKDIKSLLRLSLTSR